jgi:predicted dehydrogenase
MKIQGYFLLVLVLIMSVVISGCQKSSFTRDDAKLKLITLDPGHFHAALVQKQMYRQISPNVSLYAPAGPDIEDHLARIEGFNTRSDNPTSWVSSTYTGDDFLEKMLMDEPGSIVVVAGNNSAKTDYIYAAVDAGMNVLADKPMVIFPEKFDLLVKSFEKAHENGVLIYDIMTERHEITTMLQKELSQVESVFGTLKTGTPENPAVTKESVHHFFKYVSGNPIKRPGWFFDPAQRGEALTDVSTHLVDLIQWECYPGQIIDYKNDIQMHDARRWTTQLTPQQFSKVTGLNSYPEYLAPYVAGGRLNVFSNGEMVYRIKDTWAKVSVLWEFQAPEGTGDTHYSIMQGTKSNLIIRQGPEENYKPTLYVETWGGQNIEQRLLDAVNGRGRLQKMYPGLGIEKAGEKVWKVVIPDKLRIGHEAHFIQVTEKYLGYLRDGRLPAWEVPNMLAKYYTTTEALKKAAGSK